MAEMNLHAHKTIVTVTYNASLAIKKFLKHMIQRFYCHSYASIHCAMECASCAGAQYKDVDRI